MLSGLLSHFSPRAAFDRLRLSFRDKRCPVCRSVHMDEGFLCLRCSAKIELKPDNICINCGKELNSPDAGDRSCISCKHSRPHFSRLYFYGVYDELLREMILGWKFYNQFGNSAVFENYIANLCHEIPETSQPDIIIPVPLHTSRLQMRGFNQSRILAKGAACATGTALSDSALVRVRRTIPQTRLSGVKRRENLLEAFIADSNQVSGKKILLIDDVFTTGSTADECARTLRAGGASGVEVMALARALI
ncbi:ComF family protein [Maridesulfovibrio hydrothermalis]|uniref:Phosphoribosyltransferase n=1 Tax=Maridesulfovibrio hydrothermalis AM13 = DSM 14728 TaxID=1121451 RepID=L0R6L3_9BACT|nr:ComF family protein [Maridesulfovibrio hydrothermalis]CCO22348.1 Phosphoribosyltransferase [Maridesulfovibrio hydrothermalis AM13 = DSM 14728]